MMSRAVLFLLALLVCAQLALGAAIANPSSEAKRDVFVPPVLYPHAGTVWTRGQLSWELRAFWLDA